MNYRIFVKFIKSIFIFYLYFIYKYILLYLFSLYFKINFYQIMFIECSNFHRKQQNFFDDPNHQQFGLYHVISRRFYLKFHVIHVVFHAIHPLIFYFHLFNLSISRCT